MRKSKQTSYQEAAKAFAVAFEDGLAAGSKARGSGQPPQDEDFFTIDVPRPDVRDGLWAQYVETFREAGHRAALHVPSGEEAFLLDPESNSSHTFMNNEYRWVVFYERTEAP